MNENLFTKPPRYTIDTSSLIEIFGTEKMVSKRYTPGLWEGILDLIAQGVIVSHIEVLNEIKKDGNKGEELYDWAHANKHIFRDYDWINEGRVIRSMSPKYESFVNGKTSHVHADPWLVAQAKFSGLTIISEEQPSGSKDVTRHKLPNVCADPLFNVKCINLLGLIREQGWTFRR